MVDEKKDLKNQLESLKVFMFMIIHDLKHPAVTIKHEVERSCRLISKQSKQLNDMLPAGHYKSSNQLTAFVQDIEKQLKDRLDVSALDKSSDSEYPEKSFMS